MKPYRELIDKLTDCIEACEYCAMACLEEENVKEMINCIKTDRDCADICSLSIHFLSRESKHSNQLIEICAAMCEKCAEECEKHDHDHCVECASACRRREESCRAYLN